MGAVKLYRYVMPASMGIGDIFLDSGLGSLRVCVQRKGAFPSGKLLLAGPEASWHDEVLPDENFRNTVLS